MVNHTVDGDNTTVLPILTALHPLLRQKANPVRPEDLAMIQEKVPVMFDTMYRANGIGLAANQIGVALRFFVMDLMPNNHSEQIIMLNPEIISYSDQQNIHEEGCLSVPSYYGEVTRPQQVKVRYQDLLGQLHELEADGLLSTCIQHEKDHLDGILFIDHLSSLRRNIILRKLTKDMKQKIL